MMINMHYGDIPKSSETGSKKMVSDYYAFTACSNKTSRYVKEVRVKCFLPFLPGIDKV